MAKTHMRMVLMPTSDPLGGHHVTVDFPWNQEIRVFNTKTSREEEVLVKELDLFDHQVIHEGQRHGIVYATSLVKG